MTRTTTTSAPDGRGMIEIESREKHGDVWLRLKFRWLGTDIESPAYRGALAAHHASMDYLMAIPAAEVSRNSPWALEKPIVVAIPPQSTIATAAVAEPEPVVPEAVAPPPPGAPPPNAPPPNAMRDAYRTRGL